MSEKVDTLYNNICTAIKEALRRFGEYSYFDKGPDEVMDIGPHAAAFKQFTPEEAAELLNRLGYGSKAERMFVTRLYMATEGDNNIPDSWFEEINPLLHDSVRGRFC